MTYIRTYIVSECCMPHAKGNSNPPESEGFQMMWRRATALSLKVVEYILFDYNLFIHSRVFYSIALILVAQVLNLNQYH